MAFDAVGLQAFNNGGALGGGEDSVKTLWHYVTNDADTVVETNGYFDTTAMKAGDLVFASLDLDGTPEVKAYVVAAGTGDPDSNDVSITAMLIA
jgi:hypothetical protein